MTKQDLSTSDDYSSSLSSHYEGKTQLAVLKFPTKEPGGFVTAVEKLWLNLINKTPDMGDATEVGAALSERTTLSVSKETKSYFYKESEDGYFPAEHEAILLHILSGFTFAAEGKREEATIEARKAAFYLQNEYGSNIPFDDPALRLWLGYLWLYCGEWQHARVDFRVAASLSEKYSYLKKIADRESPPKSASLVLAGSGPQIFWTPALDVDVVSGMQNITFKTNYAQESFALFSNDGKKTGSVPEGLPTISWYNRHQERDHAIRKVLQQSRYTVEAGGATAAAVTTKVAGTALAISIAATGIAGGLAILYYTASYLKENAFYLAILPGALGVALGHKVYEGSSKASQRILEAGLSPVDFYRYVRFLPDYVHLAVSDDEEAAVSIRTSAGRTYPSLYSLKSPDNNTSLNMFYVPGGFYSKTKAKEIAPVEFVLKTKESKEWLLSEELMTFEQAYRFCERQSVRSGKNFRIPTNVELKLGVNQSFGDKELLTSIETAETVWAKAPFVDSFTSCRHFNTKAKTEHLNSACGDKHRALCGDLGH